MGSISLRLCGSSCLGGEISLQKFQYRGAEIPQSARTLSWFAIGLLVVMFVSLSITGLAQTETKRNDRPPSNSSVSPSPDKKDSGTARYTWEFSQKEFLINYIMLEHDATGRGKVAFTRKGEGEPITEKIELSEAALERIDKLWVELRFLDSNENYQASKDFAHLGTYKLGMSDRDRKRTAEFNWSSNSIAWALAQEYRRVADQAIFVFDVTVARENQPLNTPGLMKQLESMYNRNALSDPKQLVPLLKELSTDAHIPLIARNQADRLLKKIEKTNIRD